MRRPLVQRCLIALVQVLAMGVWFSASAVVPALTRQWHMSAGRCGLADRAGAGRIRGRGRRLGRVRPGGPGTPAPACRRLRRRRGHMHPGHSAVRGRPGRRGAAQVRHRGLAGRRLPGRHEDHGLLVGARWPGAGHGSARRLADPWVRPAAPDRRAVAAELARGAGRGRGHRPFRGDRGWRADQAGPAFSLRERRRPPRLRPGDVRRQRPPPGQPGLFRAHVGAVRTVDMVAGIPGREHGLQHRPGSLGHPGRLRYRCVPRRRRRRAGRAA